MFGSMGHSGDTFVNLNLRLKLTFFLEKWETVREGKTLHVLLILDFIPGTLLRQKLLVIKIQR